MALPGLAPPWKKLLSDEITAVYEEVAEKRQCMAQVIADIPLPDTEEEVMKEIKAVYMKLCGNDTAWVDEKIKAGQAVPAWGTVGITIIHQWRFDSNLAPSIEVIILLFGCCMSVSKTTTKTDRHWAQVKAYGMV